MKQQKQEVPIKTKEQIEEMLNECRVQLAYIDAIYPTGTSAAVLSRLVTFIDEYEREPKEKGCSCHNIQGIEDTSSI